MYLDSMSVAANAYRRHSSSVPACKQSVNVEGCSVSIATVIVNAVSTCTYSSCIIHVVPRASEVDCCLPLTLSASLAISIYAM